MRSLFTPSSTNLSNSSCILFADFIKSILYSLASFPIGISSMSNQLRILDPPLQVTGEIGASGKMHVQFFNGSDLSIVLQLFPQSPSPCKNIKADFSGIFAIGVNCPIQFLKQSAPLNFKNCFGLQRRDRNHSTKLFFKKMVLPFWLTRRVPILKWFHRYRVQDFLIKDIISGLTVGVMAIPQALSYAGVAGLAPQYGLYNTLMGLLPYFIFGTSSYLVTGPTAVMSIIVASSVPNVNENNIYNSFLNLKSFFV